MQSKLDRLSRGVALIPGLMAQRVLELNPNSAIALAITAWAEVHLGNAQKSIELCLRAERLNPRDPRGWMMAVERMPQIQGLKITASRVVPAPEIKRPDPKMTTRKVEVEFEAAGTKSVYSFLCVPTGQRVVIQVLGLTR